jgi:heme/copper-type cytochrome/quinol oxidase subunit 2
MSSTLTLLGCATCRPAAGSLAAQAQDSAVIVMLVALAMIFAIVFYTMFSFTRRQRRYAEAQALLQQP